MNEYRKRIAALKVGDAVIIRSRSGGLWTPSKVTALAGRRSSNRGYILGAFIEAGGFVFNEYGSVEYEDGKTSGCRCIVPEDMWKTGAWKPGAIPPAPKTEQPCVDCKGAKGSVFSPRCADCRVAHAAKKKVEYKRNRQEQAESYRRWQEQLLP